MNTHDIKKLDEFFKMVICGHFDATKPDLLAKALDAKLLVDSLVCHEKDRVVTVGPRPGIPKLSQEYVESLKRMTDHAQEAADTKPKTEGRVIRQHVKVPTARQLFFDIIELLNMRLKKGGGLCEIIPSEDHVDEAERYIDKMVKHGFKIGNYTANNMANDRVQMYYDYPGFVSLHDLLQHIWDGTTGVK